MKNATFIKKKTTHLRWPICGLSIVTQSDISCLFTFLVRKKNFLWKTDSTHFRFSWMRKGYFCHFWTFLLVNLKPVCILKKIVTMNVAETSRKNFCLSNIRKNTTFIENNFFPEMARLWTFFSNPKWFQLFVYFFSKKIFFSQKDYPNSF